MDLNGKVVLITGAASGIGAETACYFAKMGAKLSIIDLNEKQLTEVVNKISQTVAAKPFAIVADVNKDAERIINETIEHFGQLDVLVNNAGIGFPDSIVDFDVNGYDRTMNTNIRSMIVLTNLAVPYLEKTKGNIVNISSICGLASMDTTMSYCISKAAVNQFTKCSAIALAPKGIRSNAIAPGVIKTPIYLTIGQTADEFLKSISKGKSHIFPPAEPSNIARGIAYLATEPFINGIILPIDGGYLC